MPLRPNKPTLRSLDFGPSTDGSNGLERLVTAEWSGPPIHKTTIGSLYVPTGPAQFVEAQERLYRWHLHTGVVEASFLCPTNDATDSRPLAAARWIIRAAYRACGYGLYAPSAE